MESFKTNPVADLKELVAELFGEEHEVRFYISPRGFQKIDIYDREKQIVWNSLEGLDVEEDMNDYKGIAISFINHLEAFLKKHADL